jgi:hypothetical protein
MFNFISKIINQRNLFFAGIASIALPLVGYLFTSTGAVTYAKLGIDVVCDLPADKRTEITNNIREALGGNAIILQCKNDIPVITVQPDKTIIDGIVIPERGIR